MNKADKDGLRALIQQRTTALQSTLVAAEQLSETGSIVTEDSSAKLDSTIGAAVDSRVLASARIELQQLSKSLVWLDSDDAGFCSECDSEIPLARLKALPATRVCVSCAELQTR